MFTQPKQAKTMNYNHNHLKPVSSKMLLALTATCCLWTTTSALKCYSCASENLQTDFFARLRRPPQQMVTMPKMFDNSCDLDTWVIKVKTTVDCQSSCYKWQQIVNNSGVFSYMTVRDCYDRLFGQSARALFDNECQQTTNPLACLPEANLIETQCQCKGSDFCNGAASRTNAALFFVTAYALAWIWRLL